MDEVDFTEDEIREQLEKLGYSNVPSERLAQFKRDLEQLVRHERSKNSSTSTAQTDTSTDTGIPGVPNQQRHAPRRPLDEANRHQLHPAQTYSLDHRINGKENQEHREIPGGITQPSGSGHPGILKSAVHGPAPGRDVRDKHPSNQAYYREPIIHMAPDPQALADTSITSTTSSERRAIMRRVLRKRDGQTHICDESVSETASESDPDEMSYMQERLRQLRLSVPTERPSTAPPSDRLSAMDHRASRPEKQTGPPAYRLPEDYEGPKALIRPMTSDPHTRNLKRNDPVSRYQQYQQAWQQQRAPGEKKHKSLRWNVREQMLYHDQVLEKKPQKMYVPNSYVIPSDKKRKGLRWQIRHDLAQGVVPPAPYD